MDEHDSVDAITPTFDGFWVGVIGAVVGIAGLVFSIYTFVEKEPNIRLLILSGWVAALIASVTAGIFAHRLVKLVAGMTKKIAALAGQVSALQADNRRLMEIDAYIITAATKRARPRSVSHAQANQADQEAK